VVGLEPGVLLFIWFCVLSAKGESETATIFIVEFRVMIASSMRPGGLRGLVVIVDECISCGELLSALCSRGPVEKRLDVENKG